MGKKIGTWDRQWSVESESSNSVYTVSCSNRKVWGCSCPAWTFNRKRKPCKHIKLVRQQEGL